MPASGAFVLKENAWPFVVSLSNVILTQTEINKAPLYVLGVLSWCPIDFEMHTEDGEKIIKGINELWLLKV